MIIIQICRTCLYAIPISIYLMFPCSYVANFAARVRFMSLPPMNHLVEQAFNVRKMVCVEYLLAMVRNKLIYPFMNCPIISNCAKYYYFSYVFTIFLVQRTPKNLSLESPPPSKDLIASTMKCLGPSFSLTEYLPNTGVTTRLLL